jgi:hypothetical protein
MNRRRTPERQAYRDLREPATQLVVDYLQHRIHVGPHARKAEMLVCTAAAAMRAEVESDDRKTS